MGSGWLNPRSHFVSSLGSPAPSQNTASLGPSLKSSWAACNPEPLSFPCSPTLMVSWVDLPHLGETARSSRPQEVRAVHLRQWGGRRKPIILLIFKGWVCYSEYIPGPTEIFLPYVYLLIYSMQSLSRDIIVSNLHTNPMVVLLRPFYRCGKWGWKGKAAW